MQISSTMEHKDNGNSVRFI